jgi:hypothetical protein
VTTAEGTAAPDSSDTRPLITAVCPDAKEQITKSDTVTRQKFIGQRRSSDYVSSSEQFSQ